VGVAMLLRVVVGVPMPPVVRVRVGGSAVGRRELVLELADGGGHGASRRGQRAKLAAGWAMLKMRRAKERVVRGWCVSLAAPMSAAISMPPTYLYVMNLAMRLAAHKSCCQSRR
jgi:hypothetical protein